MKKVLFAAGLLAAVQVKAQQFTIKGDASKVKDPVEWVYLSYVVGSERKNDSALVKDGQYTFTGKLANPTMAYMRPKFAAGSDAAKRPPMRKDMVSLFLENSAITISNVDSFGNATIKGSKANDEYTKLNDAAKVYNDKMNSLYGKYSEAKKAGNKADADKVEAEVDALSEEMNEKVYGAYVKKNPKSPIALYAFQQFAGYDIDPKKVEPVFNSLSAEVKSSAAGKEMAGKIDIAKKTAVGQVAMDFTQNDTLGIPVSLSSFKGKYVLVDFWASWCGPCRAENPNVVAAFNKYKEKGFHIVGVSLDNATGKEKWIKAVHDDNLTWTHVSDLQYWKNAVAVQYGIQSIPQNLLIDPTGKIIGKNLRGEALQKKLQELFN